MELRNFDSIDAKFTNLIVDKNNKKVKGEVFTPPSLINIMISEVLQIEPNLFKNKNVKILEPASGIGNYTYFLFKHLYYDLIPVIPDSQTRIDHIIKNCLYLIEINPDSVNSCTSIFKELTDVPLNIITGDALKSIYPFEFDLIIGNPPYNCAFGANKYAAPLFHKFIEYYIDRCRILSFITPSRWFKANKNFDKLRENMFNRTDLVMIQHFSKAHTLFKTPDIDIRGGVSYFVKDSKYTGPCNYNGDLVDLSKFDILVEPKDVPLVRAITDYPKLSSIYTSASEYGISTNDTRAHLKKEYGDVLCHMSVIKGKHLFINPKELRKEPNGWIVIYSRVCHNPKFADIRIVRPDEVYSASFNGCRVNSFKEAESLVSYLKTDFACKLLSLRKMTNGFSKKTIEWVILPPLDTFWTDLFLKKYYIELNEFDFNYDKVEKRR